MTDYTPRGYPKPELSNKIANEVLGESIRNDIRKLAEAVDIDMTDREQWTTAMTGLLTNAVTNVTTSIFSGTIPGVSFSTQDAEGNRAWISANDIDGGPDALALHLFGKHSGLEQGFSPDHSFWIADANNQLGDLTLDRRGMLAEWVIERLAPRLQPYLSGSGFKSSDRYVRGEEILPVATDMSHMSIWGSSSGQGIYTHLASAIAGQGWPTEVIGQGKAGEQSQQIFARMGSAPAKLTFPSNTIPASGSVAVTTDIPGYQLKTFTGTINGVAGELSYADGAFTFTRTTAGQATASPAASEFIPTIGPQYRDAVNLIWAGKNDPATDWQGTIARTDDAFNWLAPLVRRSLILGHFVDRDDTVGSATYNKVRDVNAAHKARYGVLFVDIQAYLASEQLWADTGITPTSEDLSAQTNLIKPPSVSADSGHLNAAGYQGVCKFIIRHITSLGWY